MSFEQALKYFTHPSRKDEYLFGKCGVMVRHLWELSDRSLPVYGLQIRKSMGVYELHHVFLKDGPFYIDANGKQRLKDLKAFWLRYIRTLRTFKDYEYKNLHVIKVTHNGLGGTFNNRSEHWCRRGKPEIWAHLDIKVEEDLKIWLQASQT